MVIIKAMDKSTLKEVKFSKQLSKWRLPCYVSAIQTMNEIK